jgi:hypothetical protein
MKGLVRNYTIAGGGKSVEVPIYPTVSAAAVSEASDLSNTAINPSSVTITASEVGIMTTLTDLARNSASRNVAQDIGRVFGEAIARKIDLDLTALFDGFSTAVGGADAVLSADTVAQAHANLRNSSVPMNDLALVIHPMVAHDLKRGMTNTYAGLDTDISNEALRSGFIGTLFGVPVFETANMDNTGTAGDYKGAMFHRDALGLAMMQDLKIEVQRDASLRADEIVATAVYGVGELQDSYGIEIIADSSIQ